MPKKLTTTRSAAQRNKPKVQKSFELVRETSEEQDIEAETSAEEIPAAEVEGARKARVSESASPAATKTETPAEKETSTLPKGSAAARMAARRQASQKVQQRNASALVTPEHFAYVRKDLITIAILASMMFVAIIVLYFVLAARA